MKDVYIKKKDLCGLEDQVDKYTLTKWGDIVSIDDLLGIIDELIYKIEKLEEELEEQQSSYNYLKYGEDDRDPRDYSDSWMDE